MEIANFKYYRGGFWNNIKFGNTEDIFANSNKERLKEMFIFSTILILGCFCFGLFFVYKKEKAILYLSLFCFNMALTTVLTGRRIISDLISKPNWSLLVRLEYLSGYLLLPFFGLFFLYLFKVKSFVTIKRRFFKAFIIFSFIITLLTPNKVYSFFLEPYKWISILFAFYFLYLICISIKHKKPGSVLQLFAVLGILAAIYQEIFIRGPVSWLPFASLNFVICFLLITLQRILNILRKKDILEAEVILDPLTKLCNRNYLMKLDKKYFQVHKNTFMLFLDLDNFKYINDTFGHQLGDYILQEASKRLKNIFRNDDIICRYGGDEFIVIASTNESNDIIKIAKRIIDSIIQPFEKDGKNYQVGVSIGIAKNDDKLKDIKALIKKSDEAMYKSKKNGGNQFFIIN